METNSFEIRSEEVQDILSYVPNWMIRWGITLIALIVLIVVLFSWIIKYPDTIEGKITLTTTHPPIKLFNRMDGKLVRLLVEDGEIVKTGTLIAEIESAISIPEISYLKETINKIQKHIDHNFPVKIKPTTYTLGEVQSNYNTLIKNLGDYQAHISNTYVLSRRKTLSDKISSHSMLIDINKKRIALMDQELKNAKEKYMINKLLYQDTVIAKLDFLEKENEYHQKIEQLESAKINLINSKITISDLQDIRAQESFDFEEKKRVFAADIQKSIKVIQNYIDLWYQKNTLIAPIDGKLVYIKPLTTNQYVETSEALFSIVPHNNEFVGNVEIPSTGRGKIKSDQKVIVKFDNYPYREFGQVLASVNDISDLPNENKYMVKVVFPEGITTSYQRTLVYQPEMTGIAEIVTNDLRLFQRLLNNFKGRIE